MIGIGPNRAKYSITKLYGRVTGLISALPAKLQRIIDLQTGVDLDVPFAGQAGKIKPGRSFSRLYAAANWLKVRR